MGKKEDKNCNFCVFHFNIWLVFNTKLKLELSFVFLIDIWFLKVWIFYRCLLFNKELKGTDLCTV